MGQTNFDVVKANAFIGAQFVTQGKIFYVKPKTGSDGADGLSPRSAFKTLAHALANATAGQNDVIYLFAESNTAGSTTDYQLTADATGLVWNKDLVHLIGINSGAPFSQRSRVAFESTFATAVPLFTLSANGCLIQGIEFYAGVAHAQPLGCVSVTGQRNVMRNCHIAGMGATQMDIAGAYSLQVSGGQENLFEDCTIGQDTSTVGANTNAVLYFAAAATRNVFRRCRFLLYTSSATACQFVRAAAGSMDRYQLFYDCDFLNAIDSGSTNLTQAFTVVAGGSPAGGILLKNCSVQGATDWNATDAGNVTALGGTPTGNSEGLAVDIAR